MPATAEKTTRIASVQHHADGGSFFRKAEEPAFFGSYEQTRFFTPTGIQTKLSVSQPGDPQEQEADAVADQVMRMEEPAPTKATPRDEEGSGIMRLPDAAGIPLNVPADKERKKLQRQEMEEEPEAGAEVQPKLMRKCAECAEEDAVQARLMRSAEAGAEDAEVSSDVCNESSEACIQPKINSPPAAISLQRSGRAPPQPQASFESTLQSTKGGGVPLSGTTRQFMESRFGADFGAVRIHTGAQAETLSNDIHAQAFTHGGDIYFNAGKFAPDTVAGGHLLAHELTHTIQQGASHHHSGSDTSLSRKVSTHSVSKHTGSLQRVAAERPVPSQLQNAVAKAKGEEGQVNAGKEGPDGFRLGWEHLIDYFKTTLGEDKVLPQGGGYVEGAVAEQDIKKKREISGALAPAHPAIERKGPYVRDAMPSWCGIFVFWALHKAGVPMKPWQLGGRVVTADAAYPPGHIPQTGDIAYRQNYSHFAIVDKTSGNTVTTVNGNTAGEDNLGGQVQTRDHPLSDWTAFFDPLMLKNGPLSVGETDAASTKPLSLEELRKQVFHVNPKQEEGSPQEGEAEEPIESNAGPALSDWNVAANGSLQRNVASGPEPIAAPEEERKEDQPDQSATVGLQAKKEFAPPSDAAEGEEGPAAEVQSGDTPAIQRNIFGDAWDAAGDAVSGAYDAASDFAEGALDWAEDQLNEAKAYILERIRNYAADIPGYSLLTVILQRDPITGAAVQRTGSTLLSAGLDVIPGIGPGIRTLLQQTGTWDEAAAFVEGRIDDFISMAGSIATSIVGFIDDLGISDIRHPVQVLEDFFQLVRGVIDDVVGFVCRSADAFVEMVKRVVITQVASFVRNHIPRLYPFLRVAFGFDPITNEAVPRNGTNILNALFSVTDEGLEQKRQLMETGAFQRVAAWIDQGIYVFTNLYNAIRTGFTMIWSVISVDSLLHPIDTFERIYDHFVTPVTDVMAWIGRAALFIIQAIKDALLSRLSAWARGQRGYFLITLLIHRDPFTNAPVPFSVENVIHAFMSLMDGGEEQFQQMKESGAIDRTTNRIHAAVRRLGFTVPYIVGLFTGLWNRLRLSDLANPIALFRRVIQTFAAPVRRLVAFVGEIVRIVVEVILQIMQFPVDLVSSIISGAMAAWDRIKRAPVNFLINLLRAIKQGFVQFFDHILDHLLFGLTGWLMAELRDAGVPQLTDLSLRGVISWVLQVLGISMEAIWQKLAAHPRIGPERVAKIRGVIGRLEGIWTFIRDVQQRGIAAIWEKIQEQLSQLWDTVLDAIRSWVMEKIIASVTAKLLSMLDPTGIMAVINSVIAMYRAVQSFIRYLRQILEVINSFVQGIAGIAAGNIAVAANYLENTMRRAMPVVIGFLANQVGLGGIGHRIAEIIGRVRAMVDRALTWLVNKAVDTGFALMERAIAMGRSAANAVVGWASRLLGIEKRFNAEDGSSHRLFFRNEGSTPVLMLNPTVVSFESWINSIQVGNDAGKAAKKARAIAKAREIDTEKNKNVTGVDEEEEQEALLRTKLDELSKLTGPLFAGAKPPCSKDPATGLTFGGLRAGFYGTRMDATHLTNIQMPTGSVPDVTHHNSFRILNQRRNQRGSYYILGHLLNHNLGGTGRDWMNLTPLTREANSAHERIAESRVKTAVAAGNIVHYTVEPEYGRSSATSTDPTINEIMKEERNVPLRLICAAEMIVPAEKAVGGTERKVSLVPPGTVIENTVNQSKDAYDLTGIRPADVYLDRAKQTQLETIPGVKAPLALLIIAARRDRVKYEGTRFPSYASLAEYQLADGRKFTSKQKEVIKTFSNLSYVHLYST